ncbi:S8 family serine peptidase [Lachnospiraceae bacterium MD308]|nr:S8 family serine peptidase [Lachnospiraceae bacterium MD308]
MKKIAILDSGIDFSFKEFDQSKIEVKDFVNETNEIAKDENGHGTACCGEVIKIYPLAEMLVIKVLNRLARNSLSILYDALEYCSNRDDLAVINISSSCVLTEHDIMGVFEKLVNKLVEDGKIVVASIINSKDMEKIKTRSFPSAYKSVVGVWHQYGKSRRIYYEKHLNECLCYGSYNLMPFLNGQYGFFRGNSSFSARIAARIYKIAVCNQMVSLDEIFVEMNKSFEVSDALYEKKSKTITKSQRSILAKVIKEVISKRCEVCQTTELEDLTMFIEEEDCQSILDLLSQKIGLDFDYKMFDVEDFRKPERLLVKIFEKNVFYRERERKYD